MSDKHLGRIENSGDSGKQQQQQQFAQPWTPQMIMPKLDLSGAAQQVQSEFGNLQLVDNSRTQPLQGSAQIRHQAETSVYHSAYDEALPDQHQNRLHARVSDGHSQTHKQPQQQHREETLTGKTTIPASNTPDGYRPSETLSTSLKASDYHEGERFGQTLNIPHEKGKSNYYNGLANAHFEHGHLYGVPAHVVNGQMTSHLAQEVDIALQKKN
ncbi:hypothetical protein BH10CYA1_BH10CYA1_12570 [soil metagenome]